MKGLSSIARVYGQLCFRCYTFSLFIPYAIAFNEVMVGDHEEIHLCFKKHHDENYAEYIVFLFKSILMIPAHIYKLFKFRKEIKEWKTNVPERRR